MSEYSLRQPLCKAQCKAEIVTSCGSSPPSASSYGAPSLIMHLKQSSRVLKQDRQNKKLQDVPSVSYCCWRKIH